MELPIDFVSGSHPPLFRWKHQTPDGRVVQCQGFLPASAESAVANLITASKLIMKENKELWQRIEAMKQPAKKTK